jgi:hypothetical protein
VVVLVAGVVVGVNAVVVDVEAVGIVGELDVVAVVDLGLDEHAAAPSISAARDPTISNPVTGRKPGRNLQFLHTSSLLFLLASNRQRTHCGGADPEACDRQ